MALARVELKRHGRSPIGLGLVVGLLGAAVVAPLIGARRTVTAHDRLVAISDTADVLVSSVAFDPGALPFGRLPSVAKVRPVGAFIGRVELTKDWMYQFASPHPGRPGSLVAGRWWSEHADDEVVVSAVTARNTGLGVGDLLAYRLYTPEQFRSVADLFFTEPAGAALQLRVVGLAHLPEDAQADATSKAVWAGPEFYLRHHEQVSIHNAAVRLRRGLHGLDAFRDDLARALDEHAAATGTSRDELFVDQDDRGAQRQAGRQASRVAWMALLTFAGVAAVVGLVAVSQAYRRQLAPSADDQAVLRAVGFGGGQRLAALAAPGLVSALLGGVVTVIGSVALSPLFPIGRARDLEPHPGLEVNVALLVLGAMIWTVVVVLAITAVALAELARSSSHGVATRAHHPLAAWLRAVGAGAPLTLGVQLATDRGRPPTTVPVWSTLTGAALGVAGILAAATFDVGLTSLLGTPARFGLPYDITIEASAAEQAAMAAEMAADPDVAAVARLHQATVQLEGLPVVSYAWEAVAGSLAPVLTAGRLPTEGEVAVGPRLLRTAGKDIGDDVTVAGPLDTRRLRVVGSVLSPQESADPFNGEVVVSPHDQAALVEPGQRFAELSLRFAPGVDVGAKVAALDVRYPFGVIDESWPDRPTELAQLSQLRPVVVAVGALFVTVTAGAMTHGLLVMLRRRRGDVAILRAVGFAPGQVRAVSRWSATTVAAAGLGVGLPVGVLVGGTAWTSIAAGLHLPTPWPVPVVTMLMAAVTLPTTSILLAISGVRPALVGAVTGPLRRD